MKTRDEEEVKQEVPNKEKPKQEEAKKGPDSIVNKLREELPEDHVIDLFLSNSRIEHTFKIGSKIDVVLAYPKNAKVDETMDKMIIHDTKQDIAKEGMKIGRVEDNIELEDKINNLAENIMRTSNLIYRNILLGTYVVKYHDKVYPESEDFYNAENIKKRYDELNGLINGPIKETILQRIREFSSHIESCFKTENLINF